LGLFIFVLFKELKNEDKLIVPFVACGDLAGFDSDSSYDTTVPSLPPVTPPLAPFYLEALQQRKNMEKTD
jgi:tRNA (cytidine32/guanosine34-2'-O)-methyltransferase